ncbi:MAG: hypothetical protein ABSH15_07590 [Verrucomicrobiota bacterium]
MLGESLFYGFGLLFVFGEIPRWSEWYSYSPYYSAQGNSLLHGQLALSHSLWDTDCDLAWANGGVQQVWGLGIPILRLPLTALVHLFGYDVFPEHIATGLALTLAAFLVLMVLVKPAMMGRKSLFAIIPPLGGAALLLLFPPFLTLFNTRFSVYEEAVAHTYLCGITEAILLLLFLWKPSSFRWLVLMLVAGFGAFIRPTLVFYGFATWLIGTLMFLWPEKPNALSLNWKIREPSSIDDLHITHNQDVNTEEEAAGYSCASQRSNFDLKSGVRFRVKTCVFGSFLFYLGVMVLMWTNCLRFGSPIEFGHELNVQSASYDGSLYATRFNHPFGIAPFPIVLKELVGVLFFAHPPYHFEGDPYSQSDLFWGQAKLLRMRECYFKTYDWTYLILLLVGSILVLYWLGRSFRHRLRPQDALLMKMGLWSFISLTPLLWFYLRMPAMQSRYLLDLAPGFVVLIAIVWFATASMFRGGLLMVGVLFLGGWLGGEITSAIDGHRTPGSLSWSELPVRHEFGMNQKQANSIRVGSQAIQSGSSDIPYDGTGWDPKTGAVRPLVIVFVKDAQFLDLDLSRAADATINPDPNWVRAKIGLEFLKQENVTQSGNDWLIRFRGPQRASYRKNVQPAFIVFVPDTHLADKTTPWILKQVRW